MANRVPRLSKKDAEILRQLERAAEERLRAMVRPPMAPKAPKLPTPPIQWIPEADGKRITAAARRKRAASENATTRNSVAAAWRELDVTAGITETEPRARVEVIHAAAMNEEPDPAVRAELERQIPDQRRRALQQANRLAAEYERSLGAPAERVDRMRKREAQEAALLARKKAGGAKGFMRNLAAQTIAAKNKAAVDRAVRSGVTAPEAARQIGINIKTVRKYWPKS